ncbi:MAG: hypothetical protein LUQ39_08575, partial [Methanomassiliicoccales archaeon]|nr:hypothetical protein [Methanomassiliicoccales archaeon]
RKKVNELTGTEQNVDVLVKVLSVNTKEIEQDGRARQILYGTLADETGAVSFTAWDPARFTAKAGDTVLLRNAYTKEFGGRAQLNLGNRIMVEQSTVEIPDVVEVAASMPSFSPGEKVKVAELQDGMNNVTVIGRILSVEKREVGTEGAKIVFSGILADETGKVQYSAWHDFNLKPNELLQIARGYVKAWKGVPKLNFGERAVVTRLKQEQAPEIGSMKAKPRSIEDIERVGGATDALVIGTVVDVKEGSGLIRRCPQCKRVVQKGACRLHGKVEGIPDLRVKAVLDDGNSSMTVVLNRAVTENLLGMDLEECVRQAKEAMNTEVIKEFIEERLLARPFEMRGNVLSDEYGLMMIVTESKPIQYDIRQAAAELLTEVEGFQ